MPYPVGGPLSQSAFSVSSMCVLGGREKRLERERERETEREREREIERERERNRDRQTHFVLHTGMEIQTS